MTVHIYIVYYILSISIIADIRSFIFRNIWEAAIVQMFL